MEIIEKCRLLIKEQWPKKVQTSGQAPFAERTVDEMFLRIALEQFSKVDPELGEKIFTAGYPYNYILGEINFTSGNVSSEVGLGQNVSQFQLTAPIQPGNSGGPIFNEFGHVLGIAVQRMDSDYVKKITDSLPQNINFGIKQSVVRKLLDQAEVDFSVGNQMFNTTQKKIATLAKKGTVLISCWE